MNLRYKNLILEVPEGVYEPQEDSFLIAGELEKLNLKGKKVLDVGTGIGILALIAAKKAKDVLAIDINERALEIAKKNAKQNKISNIRFLASDLFEKINETFDLIVFNPPYVPTEEEFYDEEEKAWVGGKKGRKIIDAFLNQFEHYLNENGSLLMVQSSLSDIKETLKRLERFHAKVIASIKISWEELVVIEAHK